MIDVHCHLDNPRLVKSEPDGDVVLITNGTGWKSSEKAIALANKYPNVWACVGLGYEKGFKLVEVEKRLENLANNDKVVGIGEFGLDYRLDIDEETKEYQKQLFGAHLRVAEKLNLPVEVHNRNADEDVLKMLDEVKVKVLMHCFTRGREFLDKCVERGWYCSFGGLLIKNNNSRMRKMVTEIPIELVLLETDAPYSVANVKIVAEAVAELRGKSLSEIEAVTDANAKRLFLKLT
jgi:TatD DNase family protein